MALFRLWLTVMGIYLRFFNVKGLLPKTEVQHHVSYAPSLQGSSQAEWMACCS